MGETLSTDSNHNYNNNSNHGAQAYSKTTKDLPKTKQTSSSFLSSISTISSKYKQSENSYSASFEQLWQNYFSKARKIPLNNLDMQNIQKNVGYSQNCFKQFLFDTGYQTLSQCFIQLQQVYRMFNHNYKKLKSSQIELKFNNKNIEKLPIGQGTLEVKVTNNQSIKIHFVLQGQFNRFSLINGSVKYYNKLNQSTFEGQMVDSLANGNGRFTKNNNAYIYNGQWKNNFPNGQGQIIIRKKSKSHNQSNYIKYQGSVLNGKKCGKGVLFIDGHIFQGNFLGDKITGHCIMHCENGDRYQGQWRDNMKDGYGQYLWNNGDKYQGCYWKDKKHGYGIMYQGYTANQEDKQNLLPQKNNNKICTKQEPPKTCKYKIIYKGNWKNGRKDGNGTLIQLNKQSFQVTWSQGKLITKKKI